MVRLAAWTLLSAVLLQAHCFYKAYDITSVLDLEQQGYKFYDVDGLTEGSLEKILVRHGMLARVRLFVTQESLDNAVKLACRLKAVNVPLMLSFHFSSTWAAPSHQAMPKSWVDAEGKNLTGTALESKLRKYVSDTLTVMHKTGADIAYVALGNEISTGMLWPSGALHLQGIRASEIMGDFAKLWKNARLGVEDFSKITNKSPRVMLHLNNGWSEAIHWFVTKLLETNIVKREDIDTIGLSMYAYYNFNASPNDLYLQMKALETDWHLSSMIVETNYPVSCTKNKPSNWAGGAPPYELSVDGQLQWFQALYDIQKRLSLTIDHGISVFEPAFMTNKPGGSHCEDILLFAPDKDDYKKAIARKSIDLFKP